MTVRTHPLPETLSFKMFRKVLAAPDGSGMSAQTACNIRSSNLATKTEAGQTRVSAINVDVSVNWSQSWVVKSRISQELLDHERLHFLIAICCGRRLHDQVLDTSAPTAAELQTTLRTKLAAAGELLAKIEQAYDDETDHGRKPMEQERWASRVRAWMMTATLNW